VLAALAAAVAIVVAGALVLNRGNHKPVRRPVPAAPKLPQQPKRPAAAPTLPTGRDWPQYGNGVGRTRYMRNVSLRPPFRRVWSLNGGKLIEFQPVLQNGRMFMLKNDGRAYAIDARNGRIEWRRRVGGLAASAPAAAGGLVYFVGNRGGYGGIAGAGPATVTALDQQTGRVRWRRTLASASESSPLVVKGRLFVGSQAGTVYALSAGHGRVIWTRQAGAPVKAALAYSHGRLYYGDYGGSVTAVRFNGSVVWRAGGAGQVYATPAVAFGRVYVGSKSGSVYAFSATSGRLLWSHPTGGYVYAAPAVAAVPGMRPAVFIGSYSGKFSAIDARTGSTIWSRGAGGTISGAASVIGKTVYFSALTARRTYALSAKTGRVLWSIHKGAFNPAISDGKRIYITGFGAEYAFTTPGQFRHERIVLAKVRHAKLAMRHYRKVLRRYRAAKSSGK
jgi:outer membrane protein assembly factor BamB